MGSALPQAGGSDNHQSLSGSIPFRPGQSLQPGSPSCSTRFPVFFRFLMTLKPKNRNEMSKNIYSRIKRVMPASSRRTESCPGHAGEEHRLREENGHKTTMPVSVLMISSLQMRPGPGARLLWLCPGLLEIPWPRGCKSCSVQSGKNRRRARLLRRHTGERKNLQPLTPSGKRRTSRTSTSEWY